MGRPTASLLFDVSFEQEIRDRVREFEVLSHTEEHSELVEDFSPEEWNVALVSLKNGKAAGLDGFKNEALKYSGDNFRSQGLQLFNWIQRTETIPPTWGKFLVVFIYKDGEVADPSNYRGISLISCLAKLYLNMWTRRLTLRTVWQTSRMLSEDVQLVIQYLSSTKPCSGTTGPSNPPIAVSLTSERHLIMSGGIA